MTELTERAPLLCEAITEAFGERCEDFEPECWCCKAWAELDRLVHEKDEAQAALKASIELINRMMHVHVAPDECTSYVEESRKWFADNGGSLAAIAERQEANRSALKGKT